MFYLIKCIGDMGPSHRLAICRGGGYRQLDNLIRSELRRLSESMGLCVAVYMDGGSHQMKHITQAKRDRDRDDKWISLMQHCTQGTDVSPRDIPLPLMVSDQFEATLVDMGVDVVRCSGEADQCIARDCLALLDAGSTAFCYSDDSDFALMRSVPFIRFSELSVVCSPAKGMSSRVHVFRRSHTASLLNMTEAQLVELGILSGNDFTGHFDLSEYDNLGRPLSNKYTINTLQAIIREQGERFQLHSSRDTLQQAIEFSRDFYELRELAGYPFDPYNNSQEVKAMTLSPDEKCNLQKWVEKLGGARAVLSIGIGHAVALLMRHVLENTNSVVGVFLKDFVEEKFVCALESMLESDYTTCVTQPVESRPIWREVLFTHHYQLVCKHILRLCKPVILLLDAPHKYRLEPKDLFNENLFYAVLNEIKSESAIKMENPGHPLQQCVLNEVRPETPPASILHNKEDCVTTSQQQQQEGIRVKDALPIDSHRNEILQRINQSRVTIIHGETGCGKSSRVPLMLLQDAERKAVRCKMMVSQPRRIAASSLMKRVRGEIGDKVGLRMGHGVRDESDNTKIYFVTTGYLVRLLAYNPGLFDGHSHIVVDEVHERSVDGDILCLLVKRLLTTNLHIRVVLMSATIHTSLYQEYFGAADAQNGNLECLSVGHRRFPISTHYVEDLHKIVLGRPEIKILVDRVLKTCDRVNVEGGIGIQFFKDQSALAVQIVHTIIQPGTAVLIFVSGMSDIVDLTEKFAGIERYKVYGIHSEIPFEEQEDAFEPVKENEIKVVIATNAAESSITLPDVDVVLCLGTNKIISYNVRSHESVLRNTFISKASAIQRAGRTGRVRPGAVYRLYSQKLFESFKEYGDSEILRTPLQETILSIRVMMEMSMDFEGVVPVLEELIEPPDLYNIQRSFEYLHDTGMITSADDTGQLTPKGRLVGILPVGIPSGLLITYGVMLGVRDESVILAAALSQPHSAFRIASPIVHKDPDEFNRIVQTTFFSACKFDEGTYSEPIMLLNLLNCWRDLPASKRDSWCKRHGVVSARLRHFHLYSKNLADKLQQAEKNQIPTRFQQQEEEVKRELTHSQVINMLRLILLWTSKENILRMKPQRKLTSFSATSIELRSNLLTPLQLSSLFPQHQCPCALKSFSKIHYSIPVASNVILDAGFLEENVYHFVVNVMQYDTPVVWIRCRRSDGTKIHLVCVQIVERDTEPNSTKLLASLETIHPEMEWIDTSSSGFLTVQLKATNKKQEKKFNAIRESIEHSLFLQMECGNNVHVAAVNCVIPVEILEEYFLTDEAIEQGLTVAVEHKTQPRQLIEFEDAQRDGSLINDVALGIRLFNAYLSGYNKRKIVRVRLEGNNRRPDEVVGSAQWAAKRASSHDDQLLKQDDGCMILDAKCESATWKIFRSDNSLCTAIMPRYSVPGAAVYRDKKTLFGVAYKVLELNSSLVKCEGVSFLPPGCEWISLALMCIGVNPIPFFHGGKFPNDESIDSLKLDQVDRIHEILSERKDECVAYDAVLADRVNSLFFDWTHFPDKTASENNDMHDSVC